MTDFAVRCSEREGASAPPGSPERQRYLIDLHRRGVDPLPLVEGDRVKGVAYFANRRASQFDGLVGTFFRYRKEEGDLDQVSHTVRALETVVFVDSLQSYLSFSWIEPEGLS